MGGLRKGRGGEKESADKGEDDVGEGEEGAREGGGEMCAESWSVHEESHLLAQRYAFFMFSLVL